jgi:hypothetical protein
MYGEWRRNSNILDLGTWMGVVGFTPRPLYPQGNRSQYPFYRRLDGPSRVLDGVKKIKIPCPWRESNPGRPACLCTDSAFHVKPCPSHIWFVLRSKHGGQVLNTSSYSALYPQEEFRYSFLLEAEWIPGQLKNPVTLSGIEPAIFQLVA